MTDPVLSETGAPIRPLGDAIAIAVALLRRHGRYADSQELEEAWGHAGQAGVIAELAAERRHQIEDEGWTAEHDDGHTQGQLCDAACCYAHEVRWRRMFNKTSADYRAPATWPWDTS